MRELTKQQQQWLGDYCNGDISPEDFASMEAALMESADFRDAARTYLAMDSHLHAGTESIAPADSAWQPSAAPLPKPFPVWAWGAVAAVALLVGLGIQQKATLRSAPIVTAEPEAPDEPTEVMDDGIAVVRHTADAVWANDPQMQIGDGTILSPGGLSLLSGMAQIEFYGGARVILEGPVELELQSSDRAICRRGKLRAHVPPGAEGFTVTSERFELVDLGTEFGIQVRDDGEAQVEVFDGEVVLYQPDGKRTAESAIHLLGGSGIEWTRSGERNEIQSNPASFPSQEQLEQHLKRVLDRQTLRWKRWCRDARRDDRLVVHYTFANAKNGLEDQSSAGLDGIIIGSEWTAGRLPSKQALEFKRPSDRARVEVPGTFSAATFAAWIRLDALPGRRQAILLTDGHKLGHVHWQVGANGELRFGMRIDADNPSGRVGSGYETKRVFSSRRLGSWTFVCATYDLEEGVVRQYVNGHRWSEHEILYDQPLKIGRGTIGNWSEPFIGKGASNSPVRNFVGKIDDLSIWKTALSDKEILEAYRNTRP